MSGFWRVDFKSRNFRTEIFLQTSAAFIFPVLPGDLTIQAFKIFRWKYPKWSKNGFKNLKREKVIQE